MWYRLQGKVFLGNGEVLVHGGAGCLPAFAPAGLVDAPEADSAVGAAYGQAVQVLRNCSHPAGLKASGRQYGHRQVWARDSMIALLGACLVEDAAVRAALLASMATLARHQAATGCIPNHVDIETGRPNFRAYADGGLWFAIGSAILEPRCGAIQRVLRWSEHQDVDGSGLMSIQEASDWQDLFPTRGKALYVNCLYAIALRKAAGLAENRGMKRLAARYTARAGAVREALNRHLWYRGDGRMLRHISHTFSTENQRHDSLGRTRWAPAKRILVDARYYLPWVSFRQVGEWFDCLGNLLAILSGAADEERSGSILDFIEAHGLDRRPMKAIYPPVYPGSPEWRDYYGELNLPHQYHNGGVWPFIGGFYIAALVKTGRHEQAAAALERLAQVNLDTDFNEWLHGETGAPMGVAEQAWSAGMFLYAAECVARRQVLHL
jgi:hypothetical protein